MTEWGFMLPLRTYRLNWPKRTSLGGEMAMPYRHSILNPILGCLRPSTLPHDHGGSAGKKRVSLKPEMLEQGANPQSPTFQAGSFNHQRPLIYIRDG